MRARLLKPGFFSNEALGQLPPACRLLFEGLWCLADREGRLEDRPARIRVEVFPYDRRFDVDTMLTRLAETSLVVRYAINGKNCIWLPTFSQHQKCHPNEAKSALPCCPLEKTVHKMSGGDNPGTLGRNSMSDAMSPMPDVGTLVDHPDSDITPMSDQGLPMVDQGSTKVAGKKSGIGSSSVRKAVSKAEAVSSPLPPSDDPAALTLDYEGDIHFEEEGDDPETLEQDLNALFPEGWRARARA